MNLAAARRSAKENLILSPTHGFESFVERVDKPRRNVVSPSRRERPSRQVRRVVRQGWCLGIESTDPLKAFAHFERSCKTTPREQLQDARFGKLRIVHERDTAHGS